MTPRLASAAVITAVTAAVVLSGCGGSTPLAASSQVCVTAPGHIRVDDFRCVNGGMAYDWWYLTAGQTVPRIGQRATVGTLTRPKGSVRSGLPATPTTAKPTPTTKKSGPTKTAVKKPAAPKVKPAAPKVRTK